MTYHATTPNFPPDPFIPPCPIARPADPCPCLGPCPWILPLCPHSYLPPCLPTLCIVLQIRIPRWLPYCTLSSFLDYIYLTPMPLYLAT